MEELNASMLILARESRGFSQSALSRKLGVSQGTLSKVENGRARAPDGFLERVSEVLHYPASFFSQEHDIRSLPISFYRKRVRVGVRTLRAIQARINIMRFHAMKLTLSVDVPDMNVPFVDPREIPPEQAAMESRLSWRLPPGPIEYLLRTLEDAGILIAKCDFGTRQVDAISVYEPQDPLPPMIFFNEMLPGDRLRYSIAHELGHIVLHHHRMWPQEDMEEEADRFAHEFLMPATDIRPHLRIRNLRDVVQLKPYWGVSIQSLIMRAAELGKIPETRKRYLFAMLSKRGYRTKEPFAIDPEEPSLISELVQCHLEDLDYSERDLSDLLALGMDEFRSLYLATRPGSHLRLIKKA